MKHYIRYTCTAVLAAGTIIASPVLAERSPPPRNRTQMEEMMKKAEVAGRPSGTYGPRAAGGTWKAEVKCWMARTHRRR